MQITSDARLICLRWTRIRDHSTAHAIANAYAGRPWKLRRRSRIKKRKASALLWPGCATSGTELLSRRGIERFSTFENW